MDAIRELLQTQRKCLVCLHLPLLQLHRKALSLWYRRSSVARPEGASNSCALLSGIISDFLPPSNFLPALESGEETLVGGQAVLEGVMMRSPHAWAISCRKPSGEVVTMSEPLERPSEKHKWMAWPIVRGVITLGYAMKLGYRALRFSANVAIEDMMQEDGKANSSAHRCRESFRLQKSLLEAGKRRPR